MQVKRQNGRVEMMNSTDELLKNGHAVPPDVDVSNSLCSETAEAVTVIDGHQGDSNGTVWPQAFFMKSLSQADYKMLP